MTKLEIKEVKNTKGEDAVQFIITINDKVTSVVIERATLDHMNAMTFCKEVLAPKFSAVAKLYANV